MLLAVDTGSIRLLPVAAKAGRLHLRKLRGLPAPVSHRPRRTTGIAQIAWRNARVSSAVIFGWIISLAGTALWLYGYLATGHAPLINWHAKTAWWISDFLPNVESEIGMILVFAGTGLLYWPRRR
jgi:hypothetical protein